MKIALNMGNREFQSEKQEQTRVLEHDIMGCKNDDWEAKARLLRAFTPLLTQMAKKRSNDNNMINKYMEAGKTGIVNATKKFKSSIGADRFQIFAVDFIEEQMNRVDHKGGFIARLFGRG